MRIWSAEVAKTFLPLFQALAEGKEIQVYDKHYDRWKAATVLGFSEPVEHYRIKPKTKRVRLFIDAAQNICSYNEGQSVSVADLEHRAYFVKWVSDWMEIEV
jgi:hypothetical protein